jgi:sugar phosphate isomerase/epimerase
MYKNLNPASLGVSGRQSELIEAALTYGFRGLDIDAGETIKRALTQGVEEAARYIRSGKAKVGGWMLPVNLSASDEVFAQELERLHGLAEAAKQIGFTYCTFEVKPVSEDLPYHENFERHRERLGKVGDVLGQREIRLGLALKAAPAHRQNATYQFIHRAEELLTLLHNIDSPHVGLAVDTWNWKVGGGGRDQLDELTGPQVVSLTIADLPEDVDPKTISETQRLLPQDESIDLYGSLLKSFAQRKYVGPVTLRPHPSNLAKLTRDASVDLCARKLDQIWATAGLNKAGKLAPSTPV